MSNQILDRKSALKSITSAQLRKILCLIAIAAKCEKYNISFNSKKLTPDCISSLLEKGFAIYEGSDMYTIQGEIVLSYIVSWDPSDPEEAGKHYKLNAQKGIYYLIV